MVIFHLTNSFLTEKKKFLNKPLKYPLHHTHKIIDEELAHICKAKIRTKKNLLSSSTPKHTAIQNHISSLLSLIPKEAVFFLNP